MSMISEHNVGFWLFGFLVLPQRGIAILGVCVWVCGDGRGFRLCAYLPAPGARRPTPGARRPAPSDLFFNDTASSFIYSELFVVRV